jgi:hypothetical protein
MQTIHGDPKRLAIQSRLQSAQLVKRLLARRAFRQPPDPLKDAQGPEIAQVLTRDKQRSP